MSLPSFPPTSYPASAALWINAFKHRIFEFVVFVILLMVPHRMLGGENANKHPQTRKSFRFVRACAARFPILCPFKMKMCVFYPVYFSFVPAGFLFDYDAFFPFQTWIFVLGLYLLRWETSSTFGAIRKSSQRRFLKRVIQESSQR